MDKKQLKDLTDLWYRKLKAKGFTDLEDKWGGLKSFHSSRFLHVASPTEFAAKEKYFQLAGQLLHRHKFDGIRDRRIWDLHSQGWTQEEIADKVALHQGSVSKIIARIERHLSCEEDCCTRGKR